MTPLKITFQIEGGVVTTPYPLHLDALLAASVTMAETSPDVGGIMPYNILSLRALALNLPLARHEQEGEWVWKASALMPVGAIRHTARFYTQRLDKRAFAVHVGDGRVKLGRYQAATAGLPGVNMTPYQNKIDTLRGPHRNLLGFYQLIDVSAVECWCVGDQDEIEDYLVGKGWITHIGARRRSGHGKVLTVTVEADPAAEELWKLRVKPWQMDDDDLPIQAAWRAPYWAAENRGSAFCPSQLI